MKSIFSLLFLSIISVSIAQPRLEKQEISEGISMLVPDDLKRTPQTVQRTTSPALAVFNSQDGQTDLGVNLAQLRWNASDLELLSQFYKANILNLYDNVTMHDEGIKEINGNQFITFEFSGTIVDEGNAFSTTKQNSDYTFIMYSVRTDGVIIFRFTTPLRLRSKWQAAVKKCMNSVVIAEKKKRK